MFPFCPLKHRPRQFEVNRKPYPSSAKVMTLPTPEYPSLNQGRLFSLRQGSCSSARDVCEDSATPSGEPRPIATPWVIGGNTGAWCPSGLGLKQTAVLGPFCRRKHNPPKNPALARIPPRNLASRLPAGLAWHKVSRRNLDKDLVASPRRSSWTGSLPRTSAE